MHDYTRFTQGFRVPLPENEKKSLKGKFCCIFLCIITVGHETHHLCWRKQRNTDFGNDDTECEPFTVSENFSSHRNHLKHLFLSLTKNKHCSYSQTSAITIFMLTLAKIEAAVVATSYLKAPERVMKHCPSACLWPQHLWPIRAL